MQLSDIVGLAGVIIILTAYLLLQLGRWRPSQARYSAANAVGAANPMLADTQPETNPAPGW